MRQRRHNPTSRTRANGSSAVSIHHLAKRLGVSSTTVWRALHDFPRISAQTKARVVRAARSANYRPSLVARNLSTGRTQTLGVVVPMIGHPVYAALVRGVEQVAFEKDYNILLCDTDYFPDREQAYIEQLVRRRVDGVILLPFSNRSPGDYKHLGELHKSGTPMVAVQQSLPGHPCPQIIPDNFNAGRAVTAHLIEMGRRRIGFLHGGLMVWQESFRERFRGYRQALREAGITFDPALVVQVGSFESGLPTDAGRFHHERVGPLLRGPNPPTAVFAPTDVLAIKVMAAARSLGLCIPDDLAIAGFDNIQMSAYTVPPLTTVEHPSNRIGRLAAQLIFDQLERRRTNSIEPVKQSIPCELIIRDSSGAAVKPRPA